MSNENECTDKWCMCERSVKEKGKVSSGRSPGVVVLVVFSQEELVRWEWKTDRQREEKKRETTHNRVGGTRGGQDRLCLKVS